MTDPGVCASPTPNGAVADQAALDIPSNVIRESDTVIIVVNGDTRAIHKVTKHGSARIGKSLIPLKPLIGALYGSSFTVGPGTLTPLSRKCMANDWEADIVVDQNNSKLLDAGEVNQQLTNADIARMKGEGMSGEAIIEALKAKSTTFCTKTKFSQEKYIKRKAKKYLLEIDVLRPTAASICETYFKKDPWKIQYMRHDTLALLVSLANIGAHADVLVLDNCNGLVTGAVVERMGGYGRVVSANFGGRRQNFAINDMMNPRKARSVLLTASVKDMLMWASEAEETVAGQPEERGSSEGTSSATATQPHPTTMDNGNQAQLSIPAKRSLESGSEEEARPSKLHIGEDTGGRPRSLAASPADCPQAPTPSTDGISCPQPSREDAAVPHGGLQNGHSAPGCTGVLSTGNLPGLLNRTVPLGAALCLQDSEAERIDEPSSSPVDPADHGCPGQANGGLARGNTGLEEMPVDEEATAGVDRGLGHADADMDVEGDAAGVESRTHSAGVEDEGRQGHEVEVLGKQEGRKERESSDTDNNAEVRAVCSRGFGCCILANPHVDPKVLIRMVLPLLAPSASFAIYSLWLQPLAEAAQDLKLSKAALCVQVSESWSREYQVLPARTHPQMSTSGTGGYILSGIKVLP